MSASQVTSFCLHSALVKPHSALVEVLHYVGNRVPYGTQPIIIITNTFSQQPIKMILQQREYEISCSGNWIVCVGVNTHEFIDFQAENNIYKIYQGEVFLHADININLYL